MKTSYMWLQDYVDIDWTPEQLAEELTMAGLEVEEIETIGDLPETIVVGKILERATHPDADKLSVCQVDDGSGDTLTIVCGAPNCDAGKRVPVARIGTKLAPDFTIKKAKIRGQASFGMMCSEKELGISEEADGLMDLAEDAPVGTPLRDYLGVDTVIDWEVTPNRPDWLSHIGIARETAVLNQATLKLPDVSLDEAGGDVNDHITIDVQDPDLCPRYTARFIRNVTIGPSPKWLKTKLRAIGLRPINNVVDITNLVLHECGQPLHAFDYAKIRGKKIIVRRAADGEKMQTLDEQVHELSSENLLIADAEGGIALAGVMGGGNSEISETTTDVLLESAAFDAPNIRKTSKTLGLSTDSSYRFERGTDFNMVEYASARAAKLIAELAGGEIASGMVDASVGPYQAPELRARYAWINKLIGIEVPQATVREIFIGLGLEIRSEDDKGLTVAAPSWRLDLEREADLIEEIARVHGFDKIPPAIPGGKVGGMMDTDDYFSLQAVGTTLLGLGLDECVHIGPVKDEDAMQSTGFKEDDLVKIANPLSNEYGVMRPTLLCSMLKTVGGNIAHGNHDLHLFEIGRAFEMKNDKCVEHYECCIILTGRKHPERFSAELEELYDFYDLSGMVSDMFQELSLPVPEIRPGSHPALVGGVTAEIVLDGNAIGHCGQVAKALVKDMRIRNPLFAAIINLKPILKKMGKPRKAELLSPFPSTSRDVAFVAGETLAHKDVLNVIASCKVKILEDVHLFDIFRDDAIGAGKKSMAYSLTFRSKDRTLKDKEVNKAHENIKSRLVSELGVEIR